MGQRGPGSGRRTRGWPALERNGHVVRKGHAPAEWTPVSVKRVLLQPINAGTLVYNRRQARGKTHVPRPVGEHVVVEGFCAPIFSLEEFDDLRRLAAEIEGERPARAKARRAPRAGSACPTRSAAASGSPRT